jgi:hypothetical protein
MRVRLVGRWSVARTVVVAALALAGPSAVRAQDVPTPTPTPTPTPSAATERFLDCLRTPPTPAQDRAATCLRRAGIEPSEKVLRAVAGCVSARPSIRVPEAFGVGCLNGVLAPTPTPVPSPASASPVPTGTSATSPSPSPSAQPAPSPTGSPNPTPPPSGDAASSAPATPTTLPSAGSDGGGGSTGGGSTGGGSTGGGSTGGGSTGGGSDGGGSTGGGSDGGVLVLIAAAALAIGGGGVLVAVDRARRRKDRMNRFQITRPRDSSIAVAGKPVTFTAQTDPPKLAARVRWSVSTQPGTAGVGETFVHTFHATGVEQVVAQLDGGWPPCDVIVYVFKTRNGGSALADLLNAEPPPVARPIASLRRWRTTTVPPRAAS